MTLNRHQNRFDLYFADPRSTVAKLALRDESDTYIRENVFDNIIFYRRISVLSAKRADTTTCTGIASAETLSSKSLPALTKYKTSWVMTLKTAVSISAVNEESSTQCYLQDRP